MLQQEHRKEKNKSRRAANAQKIAARDTKFSARDPNHVKTQIAQLEAEGRSHTLTYSQQQRLDSLKHTLESILRAKRKQGAASEDTSNNNNNNNANLKSIYYDPKINPSGNPPQGYPYCEWDPDGSDSSQSDSGYETSESVSTIPMPAEKVSDNSLKQSYEAQEQLRDFVQESTKLVPTVLTKKRRHR